MLRTSSGLFQKIWKTLFFQYEMNSKGRRISAERTVVEFARIPSPYLKESWRIPLPMLNQGRSQAKQDNGPNDVHPEDAGPIESGLRLNRLPIDNPNASPCSLVLRTA